MADPFRLEALKRLTAALEEITPANGYQHDMGGRVKRGRLYFGKDDPVPLLSILEVPQALEQLPPPKPGTVYKGPWELVIQGWVVDDRDNPTDPAHLLLADVKKRLAQEKAKSEDYLVLGFKRNVTSISIGSGVVHPPDDISALAYFWLTITLEVVDHLEDPYDFM